ncbi:MAG: GtrA family protein [Treponema sp.]|jgi:putative flippase GtrA|nr:GtrA family protein [Treponema sp.]
MIDKILGKFVLVGLINTLTGALIMFGLYNLAGFNYWISSAANYFLTSILSFFLNKHFTFQYKGWSIFLAAAFVVNIALSYLLAYGIAKPMMYRALMNQGQKIRDNFSLVTGMCLFTGFNYVGQRQIVFRGRGK